MLNLGGGLEIFSTSKRGRTTRKVKNPCTRQQHVTVNYIHNRSVQVKEHTSGVTILFSEHVVGYCPLSAHMLWKNLHVQIIII